MNGVRELKLLLDIPVGDTEHDELLLALLEHAAAYAKAYCHTDAPDEFLSSVIVRMAAEDYGALGAAGLDRRSFSGLSENYRPSYSGRIIAALRSRRKPGVIG